MRARSDGFGEELDADVALGGAEGAAQPDLGAAFEDGDDHDVGHPDRPDQEGHRAEAQEEAVEGALGVGLGDEGGRGLGDVHLARVLAGWRWRPRRLSTASTWPVWART